MNYRRLGKAGIQLSELSLGSWLTFGKQIEDSVAEQLMAVAYDNGINFFDNAEIYARGQAEVVMGNIFKKMGWNRDTYVVSSKVFWGGELPNQTGLSRKHIAEACNASLKRLQVDYLDLYFCHRPDPNTPIEETVLAMNLLIQQGKILYWGTSEWSANEIMQAILIAKDYRLVPPSMEQPQYNMFHRERFEHEYEPLFKEFGYGSTIWSPLASGVLSGKYSNEIPTDTRLMINGLEWLREKSLTLERIEKTRDLATIAGDLGVTLPQLAIAWCLQNKYVSTVILGASKVQQLEDNLEALQVVSKITKEIRLEIEKILNNAPIDIEVGAE